MGNNRGFETVSKDASNTTVFETKIEFLYMKKTLILTLVAICIITNTNYSQRIIEPKLVGRWIGGEDFQEFIYHTIQEFNRHLQENPNGRIVARLCSKNKMSVALVTSNGGASRFPWFAERFAENIKIPVDRIFFARSSKCGKRMEEYWFVPENTTIDYDEIILAERVKVGHWLGGYYENPNSVEAKKEFADHTKQFIEELKNNPKAEGFIIRNLGTKTNYFRQALKQIQKEKIEKGRYQITRDKLYSAYFPRYMIVMIKE